MKFNHYTLLGLSLLFAFCFGCSQSDNVDPTPPDPDPGPDYSVCKYTFTYKLNYSPLNKNKPTTVTYLDADQKVKTTTLADTSFSLTVNYKYGDSVYVKLSPGVYFLNKPTAGVSSTNNKISRSAALSTQTGTCPAISTSGSDGTISFASDTLISAAVRLYGVSPMRLTK